MTANIVFCILCYTTEPVGDDTKVWIGFYSGEHNYHEKVEMVSENFTKLNFTFKLIFTKGKIQSRISQKIKNINFAWYYMV